MADAKVIAGQYVGGVVGKDFSIEASRFRVVGHLEVQGRQIVSQARELRVDPPGRFQEGGGIVVPFGCQIGFSQILIVIRVFRLEG